MSSDATAPEETVWEGKFIAAKRRGKWEYVSRTRGVSAAVILALDEKHVLLVEQFRAPLQAQCLELPAGLIGDDCEGEKAEEAAIRELGYHPGIRVALVQRRDRSHRRVQVTDERLHAAVAGIFSRAVYKRGALAVHALAQGGNADANALFGNTPGISGGAVPTSRITNATGEIGFLGDITDEGVMVMSERPLPVGQDFELEIRNQSGRNQTRRVRCATSPPSPGAR